MAIEIPDLWSDELRVDTLPPLVILRAQDAWLGKKTQGMLRTVVTSAEISEAPDNPACPSDTIHSLDVVAHALGYSEQLLEVRHEATRVYPAVLVVPDPITWVEGGFPSERITAYTKDEFVRYLRTALQSRPTMATIESLLAMSNEKRMKSEAPAQAS